MVNTLPSAELPIRLKDSAAVAFSWEEDKDASINQSIIKPNHLNFYHQLLIRADMTERSSELVKAILAR